MCLYFQHSSSCAHPECIYISTVNQNFKTGFDNSAGLLTDIALKNQPAHNYQEKQFKANPTSLVENSFLKPQIKSCKKKTPQSPIQQPVRELNDLSTISQFIDSEFKLLLNQNVADFIIQLSSRYTDSLKNHNNQTQQRLLDLQKRLEHIQSKNLSNP